MLDPLEAPTARERTPSDAEILAERHQLMMAAGDFDRVETRESPTYDTLVEQRTRATIAAGLLRRAAKDAERAAEILGELGLDEDKRDAKAQAFALETRADAVRMR